MRTLNRTLTVLIGVVALALMWAWIARTDWGLARTLLSLGDGFDNALEPMIRIVGTLLVAIAGTRLVELTWRRLFPKPPRSSRGHTRVGSESS